MSITNILDNIDGLNRDKIDDIIKSLLLKMTPSSISAEETEKFRETLMTFVAIIALDKNKQGVKFKTHIDIIQEIKDTINSVSPNIIDLDQSISKLKANTEALDYAAIDPSKNTNSEVALMQVLKLILDD